MMFIVYILRSELKSRYYIGHTNDIKKRLAKHNKGHVRSTKYGIPWKLIYCEKYNSKSEAFKREMQIKSYKGGEVFKKIVN